MSDTTSPTNQPGEISGWPKLQMVYRSDPDRIADLLPPGITPGKSANVYVNIYCVPVLGEPRPQVGGDLRLRQGSLGDAVLEVRAQVGQGHPLRGRRTVLDAGDRSRSLGRALGRDAEAAAQSRP